MRSTLSQTLSLLAVGILTTAPSACRTPMPCPNCGDQADEGAPADLPPEVPVPDLPCGGADFMNDSYNCGSCGNECPLHYEGTAWEAGTCFEGECGPLWAICVGSGVFSTCGEICAGGGEACVANGCSGLTALLLYTPDFNPCQTPEHFEPIGVMTGSCDEQIPWESDDFSSTNVQCCCGP
ncbi:hypothetical protein [Enhygromyxa salina]|uniref:hypothetical protein n=1 Tax=Enhygromyxa salina TaxID=215803 RepID=UPI0011BAC5E0|nr:hypothetical protein [Enhygromyxa salina]